MLSVGTVPQEFKWELGMVHEVCLHGTVGEGCVGEGCTEQIALHPTDSYLHMYGFSAAAEYTSTAASGE